MSATDRELRAETLVAASPARVWEVVTDFRNLADASAELIAMKPLLRGGLRVGQQYVGWNRRKAVVWPTRNKVVTVETQQALAWDTTSSGARWIFELTPAEGGTLLTQRRPIPGERTRSGKLFAKYFLGGASSHDDELELAMGETLAHLKQVAERA